MKKNSSHHHQGQAGFSLVELLLYMGLLSIFLVVISTFFVSILDVQSRAISTSSLEENSKYISSRLKYELRTADTATNSATLGVTTSSFSVVKNNVDYTFSLSGTTLERASSSATVALHDDDIQVSDFSVRRIGNEGVNDTFQISYTLRSLMQVGGDADQKSYQVTVGLRWNDLYLLLIRPGSPRRRPRSGRGRRGKPWCRSWFL